MTMAQRLSYVMRDAAIGGHLTYACIWAGEKLPKGISWPAVLRAYDCLRFEAATKHVDLACHRALALGHPARMEEQALLKGLLCSGLEYEEIADRFGESVDVIKTYANLFCDFLERCDAQAFVTAVLNPLAEPLPADLRQIKNQVLRAMNIGFHYGPDILSRELGSVRRGSGLPSQEDMLKETTLALMDSARWKAKREVLSTDSAEYGVLKVLLATEAKEANSTRAVSAASPEVMSLSPQWQERLTAFTQKQVEQQLEANKQFQGEANAPKAPANTGPPHPAGS
jgi:hypothetical protein